jgi:hypothetical protein
MSDQETPRGGPSQQPLGITYDPVTSRGVMVRRSVEEQIHEESGGSGADVEMSDSDAGTARRHFSYGTARSSPSLQGIPSFLRSI